MDVWGAGIRDWKSGLGIMGNNGSGSDKGVAQAVGNEMGIYSHLYFAGFGDGCTFAFETSGQWSVDSGQFGANKTFV